MPYCNQCGRYIGGGMLCTWCGDTHEETEEGGCTRDTRPTEDGVATDVAAAEDNKSDGEVPSDTGTTPSENEDDEVAEMPVTRGDDVPGDVTGEVVSEGRTIVTTPEEDTHETEDPPPEDAPPTRGVGAKIGAKIGEWLVGLFTPREGETPPPSRETGRSRAMAVLCYLGVLWAIPYFFARSSRYVAYHLERGLNLLLLDCLGLTLGAVALLLGVVVPIMMPLAAAAAEVVLLGAVSMSIWHIVRVFGVERCTQP